MATTVRVSNEAHEALKEMSRQRGVSMTQLVDEAVKRMLREDLLRRGNEAYARLRRDPEAWAEELAERRLWDTALMDGLEDDPPWPED
ncbi:MAG: ribbon-helix-helix domain-containing protein [Armatimonadetes bacterium]|nr:ribbon-helix-helix domain-containing protein [Armatimonadota bacterium]